MCKSFWISMISACLALGTMDAQAATPTFDAIYVFGDSYCDVGNLFTATGNISTVAMLQRTFFQWSSLD